MMLQWDKESSRWRFFVCQHHPPCWKTDVMLVLWQPSCNHGGGERKRHCQRWQRTLSESGSLIFPLSLIHLYYPVPNTWLFPLWKWRKWLSSTWVAFWFSDLPFIKLVPDCISYPWDTLWIWVFDGITEPFNPPSDVFSTNSNYCLCSWSHRHSVLHFLKPNTT